jgi:hypothetical protein
VNKDERRHNFAGVLAATNKPIEEQKMKTSSKSSRGCASVVEPVPSKMVTVTDRKQYND